MAYGDHIQQNLEWGNFLIVFMLGVTYLISGTLLFRSKVITSFCSSRALITYTLITCILFFLIPLISIIFNNGGISEILLKVYENGFAFGPLLISFVMAINLRFHGNDLEKRHTKYVFWILGSVFILIVAIIILIVAAVISSLP